MPHPQRLGNQGVLPLPSVPMLPPHQMPYHGGDGLMPTPGSQPYPSRGMRGMRGRGRGGYHQRPSYEDEGMFRTETESAITDTANFGGNRPPYDSHYGDNQGGGRGFNRFKRGRYEGDYGHRGARPPKPQTDSICVARIPQELNTISQLNAHFQKFGNIVNIQLDPANKQAFVQFTSNAEALLALRSPEAVMNNRFIQVYLKKDEAQEGGAPAPVVPQPPRPAVRPVPTSTVPQPAMMSRTPTSLVVQPAATAAAQPKNLELKKKQQELLSKQLEQQKKLLQLLEKMKGTTSKEKDEVKAQLTALTAKIGEAMKKAREGVAKQTAAPVVGAAPAAATSWKKLSADSEKQRLDRELELLAKSKAVIETSTNGASAPPKSTTSEAGASLAESPELSTAVGTSSLPAPTKEVDQSRMEALQKTLASLQEEAKQLGIPASQIAAQVTGVPSLAGPRGRGVGMRARAAPWWGRGRGRGGRGTHARASPSSPQVVSCVYLHTRVCVALA
jgi:RNA-binding protein 26